jgi:peptidoglycan/xylan/chitin deacetylase (PgdA/CDA1 family)
MLNPYLRKREFKKGNIGVVFMLHRVSEYEKGRLISNEDLKISPSFLQKVISKYKKAGFDFLSLDDIYDLINQRRKSSRPFVSFTLDDGYLDNYTNAYPIFKKNKVPFCIFTTTDFIDKKAILWWYSIEDLILQKESILLSDGSKYSCKTYQEKWDTFRYLREKILKLPQKELEEYLEEMFSNYDINWLYPIQSLSMSWDQVKELSKEPLCTIGGHTISHPVFNQISLNEIQKEVSGGIERLESYTNSKIEHFAYPYGSVNEVGIREYEYMKKFNFKTVFVSHGGCISKNNTEMTSLPRYMLKKT